jgi:transposase
MNTELKLPDNPEALRDFARDLVKQLQCLKFENATLLGEKVTLPHEKSLLQEQINLLLHKRISANSEKYRAEQADLFNEAEAYAEESGEVESIEAESTEAGETVEEALLEPATRESMPPRKPGRKALPQELPRVEILHAPAAKPTSKPRHYRRSPSPKAMPRRGF